MNAQDFVPQSGVPRLEAEACLQLCILRRASLLPDCFPCFFRTLSMIRLFTVPLGSPTHTWKCELYATGACIPLFGVQNLRSIPKRALDITAFVVGSTISFGE